MKNKDKPRITHSTPVTPYQIPTTPKLEFATLARKKSLGNIIYSDEDEVNTSLHPSISNSLFNIFSKVKPAKFTLSYYNDFTTIDWAKAYIHMNKFNFDVHEMESWYYKCYLILSKWLLIVLIGLTFSLIAFFIDKIEILLVGFKHGYCKTNWFASQITCCNPDRVTLNVFKSGYSPNPSQNCPDWISWSHSFYGYSPASKFLKFDFLIYVALSVILACLACVVTLSTKIEGGTVHTQDTNPDEKVQPRVMYTACGSGVPEVKTILSGFVITRFLGTYTLIAKTGALILAIASGMSLGKEGPYVHLATCVGNIMSRLFPSIYKNDYAKKQILSASASAGVALAFGSPLGGVLFILEEINNYLPSHQLFQIFFCAIMSTLFLKFMNPYGTGQTVLFELKYTSDWTAIEMLFFIIIGISGGLFGAAFIKFVKWWPKKFRTKKYIKNHPIFEVFIVALLTGLITFWNPYTKQASAELVLDLATPCESSELDRSLCPTSEEQLVKELGSLLFAFVVKVVLTFITFGLKVPCGIYVPSMVVGALYGRLFSMTIKYVSMRFGWTFVCNDGDHCVDVGIYAMIASGAFMAAVTRMNITLVTILFELTSSYTYVLPISLAVAVANWSAGLIEENSLYETLLIENDYPFISGENEPVDPNLTTGDIITEIDMYEKVTQTHRLEVTNNKDDKLFIDVTSSPFVSVTRLQMKLKLLREHCLLDGCLPLIKDKICVGLIYFSELEYCLDKLQEFSFKHNVLDEMFCMLLDENKYGSDIIDYYARHNTNIAKNIVTYVDDYFAYGSTDDNKESQLQEEIESLTNLTIFVDKSPLFLNYDSELSFANLIFDRIGNRVIVLIKDGKHYGVLHKKVLIDYIRNH